jgi:hypothetical protein
MNEAVIGTVVLNKQGVSDGTYKVCCPTVQSSSHIKIVVFILRKFKVIAQQ